jgi:Holliday junction resolvase
VRVTAFETYEQLTSLLKKHGPQEFGRICQALLEHTLRELGFKTRGRSVERPDITTYTRGKLRYAIESKVQGGHSVNITQRDIDGVMEFCSSGACPILAVLLLEPDSSWILANAENLRSTTYVKITLKARSDQALTMKVNRVFPTVLRDFFELALNRGSEGLRTRL